MSLRTRCSITYRFECNGGFAGQTYAPCSNESPEALSLVLARQAAIAAGWQLDGLHHGATCPACLARLTTPKGCATCPERDTMPDLGTACATSCGGAA